MKNTPKVSICIPVRNGELYLRQALESALSQSGIDFEVIVVDNASTDSTWMLLQIIAAKDGRLRVFRNRKNIGLVGNFNACLQYANGEYIKFLCADDLFLSDCLRRMSKALDEDISISLVTCGRQLIDASGVVFGSDFFYKSEKTFSGGKVISRCLFGTNYIGEPTAVMFRRKTALRGFREDLAHLMDMEMWFYLLEQGKLFCLPESLCAIRRHSGQMTVQSIQSGALIENNVQLLNDYADKPYIRCNWLEKVLHCFRITYRVWTCRVSLDPVRKHEILSSHGSPLVYFIMPLLAQILFRKRALMYRILGNVRK